MSFSLLTLPSINWVAVGSLGTLGLLFLGLYRYKVGKLDFEHDREQRLRDLEGKAVREGEFVTEAHTIEFRESSDTAYRLKRYALRPIDGTTYLTVIIHDISIGEDLWDAVDVLFEEQDFHAEYLDS
ncbi:hypothetical protein [Saliphagus infecundisoli]|uniref:DUF3592 domain-containing protein n=1 Tax=Saliphagus infecundisoli TaxID=1849069 RepID=A0ABD5QHX0_9EURY|nr:hypothetical protein [Saliphagus infecundisoli]